MVNIGELMPFEHESPMDPNHVTCNTYVVEMCRGGYGARSLKMCSDLCSSQKMCLNK